MLLGVIIIVTLVAIAGLAIVGLTPDSSTAAYQNDDYRAICML